jgi:FtsZ-binding cell division protein ZapB
MLLKAFTWAGDRAENNQLPIEERNNAKKAMEKLQRENEEMKTKLAELSTATTSVQVN